MTPYPNPVAVPEPQRPNLSSFFFFGRDFDFFFFMNFRAVEVQVVQLRVHSILGGVAGLGPRCVEICWLLVGNGGMEPYSSHYVKPKILRSSLCFPFRHCQVTTSNRTARKILHPKA